MVFEDGIYIYVDGKPEKYEKYELPSTYNLIYFDNRKCPFCRKFDPVWDEIVQELKEKNLDIATIRVVCTYFSNNCKDDIAKDYFKLNMISITPVLLFIKKEGKYEKKKIIQPAKYSYSSEELLDIITMYYYIEKEKERQ